MSGYVEVAVHAPVFGVFHYAVPSRLRSQAQVGSRVLVPFGRRGITGVVVGLRADPPEDVAELQELDALLDPNQLVSRELVELCQWVSDYYEAPLGEVLRTALPVGAVVNGRSVGAPHRTRPGRGAGRWWGTSA